MIGPKQEQSNHLITVISPSLLTANSSTQDQDNSGEGEREREGGRGRERERERVREKEREGERWRERKRGDGGSVLGEDKINQGNYKRLKSSSFVT